MSSRATSLSMVHCLRYESVEISKLVQTSLGQKLRPKKGVKTIENRIVGLEGPCRLPVERTLNCRIIFVKEVTLNKLDGEARFTDATAADNHQLVFSCELRKEAMLAKCRRRLNPRARFNRGVRKE